MSTQKTPAVGEGPIDPARIESKLGGYGSAPASALRDPNAWQRAQEYRRQAAARMIPLDKKDLAGRLPEGEYHLSRKVDGEFTVLAYTNGYAFTVNPGGTVRVGLPLLEEAKRQLGRAGVKSAIVAGELYYRHPSGARPRVHDTSRAARQPDGQGDLDALSFAAFDLIEVDGQPAPARHGDTYARLQKLFAGGTRVHPVDAATVKSVAEIETYFQSWVTDQGGEGLVLRSDTTGSFKLKPRHTLDVVVVGFTAGQDDRADMLHDLLVAVVRKDGSLHLLGRVGTGFSDEERRTMLRDLKAMVAPSDYAEISDGHVAYNMVRPQWVIEISCLDLVTQTTRGATIDRMALSWDDKAGRYSPLRRLPLASMLSPVFVRRREDKRPDAQDARIQQVADLVLVPALDKDAHDLALPKSQVLRREVYTKTQKDKTMVRKLLLWQTHKEDEADFPAYVLHFTDYSPGRKTPLEREVRVSNSREQIEALWNELAAENIVKGWGRVS